MRITQDQPLKDYNTLGLDVRATFFIAVESEEDAETLSRDEYFRTIPFLMIGEGSNLLFNGDFKGAILHYTGDSVTPLSEDDEEVRLRVEAGKSWHELVMETTAKGWWGLENLALIPGDAGAAAVQNIGAYGAEICDVLETIHYVDLRDGSKHELPAVEAKYSYRHSVFKGAEICDVLETIHYVDLRDGSKHELPAVEAKYSYRHSVFKEAEMASALVTAIDLRLSKVARPRLEYRGLSELRDRKALTPTDVAEEVIRIREAKLPDPREIPNAGSFFMNPFVTSERFEELQAEYPEIPHYVVEEGKSYKIPAAWLIEQVGMRGYRNETVGTYDRQPLVLINHSHGTSADIRRLADLITAKVQEKFGITLHPEVRYIRSVLMSSINQMDRM